MDLSSRVLGQATATALQTRIKTPVLVIGSDRFTRQDLATVSCFNFIAAGNVNRAIAELGIKHTKDLFTNYAPTVFALPGISSVALAVIGAAFEAKGIGGDAPLEAWVARHNPKGVDGIRTFLTIKHQTQQEAATERKEVKKRKKARKARAHKLRTERFIERAANAAEGTES